MAYFMHLAVWPPKSSLSPNSEKLCDITVECGEGWECKVQKLVNTQKFKISKAYFVC
jgi:purine nucleoside permease